MPESAVAVALKPPGTWDEDATPDHELLTSPMKVTIGREAPAPDVTETRPGAFHRGASATGVWLHAGTWPGGGSREVLRSD